jgi:hypothetical protein
MAGFGTQLPPLSTVMLGTGSYPMPPHMFQKQTYQPMASPVKTAPVFTPSSLMIAPSAHGSYFNISAGFIPNPSLGMPPEYRVLTSIEAPVQTQQVPSACGSAQDTQLQAPSTQLPLSPP